MPKFRRRRKPRKPRKPRKQVDDDWIDDEWSLNPDRQHMDSMPAVKDGDDAWKTHVERCRTREKRAERSRKQLCELARRAARLYVEFLYVLWTTCGGTTFPLHTLFWDREDWMCTTYEVQIPDGKNSPVRVVITFRRRRGHDGPVCHTRLIVTTMTRGKGSDTLSILDQGAFVHVRNRAVNGDWTDNETNAPLREESFISVADVCKDKNAVILRSLTQSVGYRFKPDSSNALGDAPDDMRRDGVFVANLLQANLSPEVVPRPPREAREAATRALTGASPELRGDIGYAAELVQRYGIPLSVVADGASPAVGSSLRRYFALRTLALIVQQDYMRRALDAESFGCTLNRTELESTSKDDDRFFDNRSVKWLAGHFDVGLPREPVADADADPWTTVNTILTSYRVPPSYRTWTSVGRHVIAKFV